ncbi:hypothetical protein OS493_010937 [Desmophyllum pertusum]|uniref:Uncharacterized protein n=1 Tax=Desmophyllum pertusum TaxID=174260 RepID=A0A9W9ZEK2_9CNID|nr:hypothetical protein OS493_010937 [Desmophyllum pertusum]
MPTAGEARLKSKSLNKTSKDGASIRGKATAVKSSTNKIGEVKRKTVPRPNSGKSSIPVPVKRGAKGKENADPKVDPTVQSKNTFSKVKQAPDFRKVKQAPDFRKVHRKWQDQLSKGKAVSKKKNTTVEPFRLAENSQKTDKKSYAYNSDDDDDNDSEDDDFEIDSTALKEF